MLYLYCIQLFTLVICCCYDYDVSVIATFIISCDYCIKLKYCALWVGGGGGVAFAYLLLSVWITLSPFLFY